MRSALLVFFMVKGVKAIAVPRVGGAQYNSEEKPLQKNQVTCRRDSPQENFRLAGSDKGPAHDGRQAAHVMHNLVSQRHSRTICMRVVSAGEAASRTSMNSSVRPSS